MTRKETIARALGYLGLVPFVVFGLGCWLPLPCVHYPVESLVAYAAVILAFIGALHWGAAMAGPHGPGAWAFIASIIPALIAWLALLMPQLMALMLLLAGFTALHMFDRAVGRARALPPWYPSMHRGLTAIVVLSLLSAITALSMP